MQQHQQQHQNTNDDMNAWQELHQCYSPCAQSTGNEVTMHPESRWSTLASSPLILGRSFAAPASTHPC